MTKIKQCVNCGSQFTITDQDLSFYDKISPIFAGKKYQIPTPTLCPACRQQRRLARRNEVKLYHDTCDLTGKKIISLYSPENTCKVYYHEDWWSDKRDPLDYGHDFDSSRSFFEQFHDLLIKVPRLSTYNKRTENTEYGNNLVSDKNCYMLFVTFGNQDCYYGYTMGYNKNCVDCLWAIQSQNCYECVKIQNCYECFWSINCNECFSSRYLQDCINVDSSAFCIGLRGKKYHFLNKAYSKKEFKDIVERLEQDEVFLNQTKISFEKLKIQFPVRSTSIEQSENSSGDYLNNCKNCDQCYDVMLGEDLKYCYDCANLVDSMDIYAGGSEFSGGPTQLMYECENCLTNHYTMFSSCVALGSQNILYCDSCDACKHCFGCTGLKNKQYCILNKQYTSEEYEKKVSEIIEKMIQDKEWGEFLHISMSLFGYNETSAQVYYPLNKQQAEAKGYNRKNEEIRKTQNTQHNIQDMSDEELLKGIFYCKETGVPFKFIKQELAFYRKYNLPIPTICYNQRHLHRMDKKYSRKLSLSKCHNCGITIKTTIDTDHNIYCTSCYNKEIYG